MGSHTLSSGILLHFKMGSLAQTLVGVVHKWTLCLVRFELRNKQYLLALFGQLLGQILHLAIGDHVCQAEKWHACLDS